MDLQADKQLCLIINGQDFSIDKLRELSEYSRADRPPVKVDALVDCGLTEWPRDDYEIELKGNEDQIVSAELSIINFKPEKGKVFKRNKYRNNIWDWNPKEETGIFHFKLVLGEGKKIDFPVEVLPRKIDKTMYAALMNDIRRVYVSIQQRLAPEIWRARKPEITRTFDNEEIFQNLREYFGKLESAMRRIAENPHRKTIKEYRDVDLHELDMVDANTVFHIAMQKGGVFNPGKETSREKKTSASTV